MKPVDHLKPVPQQQENMQWNMAVMQNAQGQQYVHLEIVAITGCVIVMDIPAEAAENIGNQMANLGKTAKLGLLIPEGN